MNAPSPPDAPQPGRFVITLSTSSMPMMLQVPVVGAFAGLTLFRSRSVEDGRERYRMHLGYFATRERAEAVLEVARRLFPTAWIAETPRTDLGSLDDTLNTEFRLVRGAVSRLTVGAPPVEEGFAHDAGVDAEAHADAEARADVGTRADADAADARARAPVEQPPSLPRVSETPVVSETPRIGATPRLTESIPARPAPVQRYAVQLAWSATPASPADIPGLAIFRAYTLYAVRVRRGTVHHHGLRLGFFNTPVSAEQVVGYVRERFPQATVVPVSEREHDFAKRAARRATPAAAHAALGAQAGSDTPPASASGFAPAPAIAPAPAPAPRTSAPIRPAGTVAPPARSPVEREPPRLRTREELLALLGSNQLEVEQRFGSDPRRSGDEHPSLARRAWRALRRW